MLLWVSVGVDNVYTFAEDNDYIVCVGESKDMIRVAKFRINSSATKYLQNVAEKYPHVVIGRRENVYQKSEKVLELSKKRFNVHNPQEYPQSYYFSPTCFQSLYQNLRKQRWVRENLVDLPQSFPARVGWSFLQEDVWGNAWSAILYDRGR